MAGMITHPDVTIRNTIVDNIVDRLDVGAGSNGIIEIYDVGNNLLVTLNYADPAFGAAAGGSATANAIASGTVVLAGTANYALHKDKDGNTIFRTPAGITASGNALELDTLTLGLGDNVNITSGTYTFP